MTKGLLDEKPLLILPTLATKIGLNESIILQQIHYWILNSSHDYDGRKWIFNSYDEWQKQFPFWNRRTLIRLFNSLSEKKILLKANYNKMGIDRTNWYSIDYEKLAELTDASIVTKCHNHSDKMSLAKCQSVTTNNQRITPENTPEKKQKIKYREFVYLTDEELKLLQDKFGTSITDNAIEKLDNYKGATGKRYKSDYRAILSWVIDSLQQNKKGSSKKEVLPDWYTGQSAELDQVEIEKEKQRLKELMERDDGQN